MRRQWEGKTWGTLGDSITNQGAYQPLVTSALGFQEVINYGKGGSTMTAGGERDGEATTRIGRSIAPSLDCVTIFAGVNDFRQSKPIGADNSCDIYTFIGAYRSLIEHIWSANPLCKIHLWTSLQRDKDGYDIYSVNETGHKLGDYAEAVRTIGREYAAPVLDLYGASGFNKLTLPYLTTDGLHPNKAGYQRIAELAIAFMLQY